MAKATLSDVCNLLEEVIAQLQYIIDHSTVVQPSPEKRQAEIDAAKAVSV